MARRTRSTTKRWCCNRCSIVVIEGKLLDDSKEKAAASMPLSSLLTTTGEFVMADTAADILIDTVLDWGVEVIFGLPGDGINGIMESLRKRQDKVRFIHVRHEEAAAFMACAYAKYTGKLGVCLA